MDLLNMILMILIAVYMVILCLRISTVCEKKKLLRQVQSNQELTWNEKKPQKAQLRQEIKRARIKYISPSLGILVLLVVLVGRIEHVKVEAFLASIDKRGIAISLNKEVEEIIDPIDYQVEEEKNQEGLKEEVVISEGFFYKGSAELLDLEDALACMQGYVQKVIGVLDEYEVDSGGNSGRPDYQGELLELLGKESADIRSVDEISAEMKQCPSPEEIPKELYMEELVARKYAYRRNPTREKAWQVARAADDAISVADKNTDIYVLLVCGAECMTYYLEMLRYEEPEGIERIKQPSNNEVCLNISVMLEKIWKRSEMKDYKKHFRMLANGFLEQIDGRIGPADNLCEKYYYYYYGVGLYKIGWTYGIRDESHYHKTLAALQCYLEQKEQDEDYTKSCIDGAINILNRYPELNTPFWKKLLNEGSEMKG